MNLFFEEKQQLAKVTTTIAQAKQIKQRNMLLQDAFQRFVEDSHFPRLFKERLRAAADGIHPDDPEYYSGKIGCPHCIEATLQCSSCVCCKWRAIQAEETPLVCLTQEFCGVSAKQVGMGFLTLEYYRNGEVLSCNIDRYTPERLIECAGNITRILDGHIEWADIVINSGVEQI